MSEPPAPPRRRRRAVGPLGARPSGAEPALDLAAPAAGRSDGDDHRDDDDDGDERLARDRPPHHDRGG